NIAVAPEISGDSSFCQGGSTTLNLNQFESYLWSTGDTTQQVVIDSVGEYAVTVVDINGCEGETSISISELATPMVSISGEPFICKNGTTTLSTSDLFDSYLWSTGETSINIEIETTGSYSITVVDEEGCQGTDSILVEERDSLQFMINGVESLCSGQTGLLDAGSFISYLWSNGSTSQSIEISSAGNYSVSVSDEFGCVGQSSILVEEGTVPQPSITGPSSICEGGTALLSTSVPYASYLWSGGSTNRTFVTSQSGLQTLEVMDENGCVGRDSITITFDAVIPELSLELDFLGTCTDSCVQIRASTNLTSDFTIRWSSLNNITFDLQSSTEALTCISDTYIVSVDNDITSCSFTDSIVVDVNGRFEEAFAGIDSSICTNSVVLSANAPDGSFGQWTSASNAIIDDPSNNRTSVSDLEEGIQTFIWTLSTAECPNYSQDEVSISVNSIPLAVDDQIQIRQDDARTVSLDVSQNDELTNVSEWEVVLIAPPSFGTIESFENGLLRYSVSDLSRGNTELTYQLCNLLCPDLCTEATVLIEVEPISLEEAEVPNAFTPNGDGVNEAFVFEILEVNSAETFPDNELIVFNRWGDIVFTQKGYDNSWTGLSNNGETLPDGTYYYILRLDIPNSIIIKGDVTIIR
ncbi:MAG: gliding motility-associated C-terminal domain-containing protein, partial [Bacteroidota bacterium]